MIRLLKAHEINCRVLSVKDEGYSLLLYKDARVDMDILDELYGTLGWQRTHELIDGNLHCTISVWDKDEKHWVAKQDVGTESFAEKEKGQASDSFKRAGVNAGIGRELYTAGFIWITEKGDVYTGKNGKLAVKGELSVKEIGYNEHNEINHLVIADNYGNVRFTKGKSTPKPMTVETKEAIDKIIKPETKKEPKKLAPPKEDGEGRTETGEKLANEKQLKLMFFLAKERDWTSDLKFYLKSELNIDNSAELTHPQVSKIITMLQGMEKVE